MGRMWTHPAGWPFVCIAISHSSTFESFLKYASTRKSLSLAFRPIITWISPILVPHYSVHSSKRFTTGITAPNESCVTRAQPMTIPFSAHLHWCSPRWATGSYLHWCAASWATAVVFPISREAFNPAVNIHFDCYGSSTQRRGWEWVRLLGPSRELLNWD